MLMQILANVLGVRSRATADLYHVQPFARDVAALLVVGMCG